MRSAIILVCAIIAVQLAGQSAGWAYELKPISRVFAPSGSRATQAFEIANDGAERIALTISFSTLERDESYAETNRDAGDEFLAYPAQMILAPGGRQTVRVTWLSPLEGSVILLIPLRRLCSGHLVQNRVLICSIRSLHSIHLVFQPHFRYLICLPTGIARS